MRQFYFMEIMMKNSILLMALVATFYCTNSFASVCYSSNVDIDFDNGGLSVKAPKFICINDLKATIVSRYSGKVETQALVGITEMSLESRADRIKYLENGYEVTYTLLSDKDGTGICDKEVGYRIDVTVQVNEVGELIKVKVLSGYGYSSWDNCHDTSPDTIELNYTEVK